MKAEGLMKDRVSAAVAELRDAARKDFGAAWNERLRAVLQDEADRILRARTAELRTRLEEAVQFDVGWRLAAEMDAATPAFREKERRAANEHWSRSVRRLLGYESEAGWASALAEAAAPFGTRAAVFFVRGGTLESDGISVPVAGAPAFRNAIESRDTVVAMRTAGELSVEIAGSPDASKPLRSYLFPVLAGDRVPAVLYIEGDAPDSSALEALAAVAGAAVTTRLRQPDSMLGIAAAPEPLTSPSADDDSPEAVQARQFARVRVAEMMLESNSAVREGRERRDLYRALRKEIDAAREAYARTFALPDDFLHSELVETLANGDEAALGKGYPGPLARAV